MTYYDINKVKDKIELNFNIVPNGYGRTYYEMNKKCIEVVKILPFKRKRKIKSKRRFYCYNKVIWNPYILEYYLGADRK